MMPAAAPAPAQPSQPQPQAWPPNPNAAVSIRGLFKHFDRKIAVNGLALDIPVGSFYGLVGPNGAGKTTTLNMVTGLLVPDGRTSAEACDHAVFNELGGFDAGRLLQRILLCLIHGFSFAILASAARINGVKPYLLS